jgi:hypothetical protein
MNAQAVVPYADPTPLPAAVWLLEALLVLGFVLHILAINGVLGATLIGLWTRWFGKTPEHRRLSDSLMHSTTSLLSPAITFGIVPLLFIQVLFGNFFYTSSVLIAWPWLMVIALLLVAYYSLYIGSWRKNRASKLIDLSVFLALVFFLLIAFLFVNNMTLLITPEKWFAMYIADPTGMRLNLSEPTLIFRYAHMLLAAFGVGSLFVVALGLFHFKKEPDYGRFLIEHGGRWFIYITGLAMVAGFGLLFSLSAPFRQLFLGQSAFGTISLLLGILLGLAAIFAISSAFQAKDPRRLAWAALILSALGVVFMAIVRDRLRDAFIAPYFHAESLSVRYQVGPMAIFFALFILGLIFVAYMFGRFFRPERPASS